MHPIFDRLKERKIVQWALAYLAGAGVLYSTLDGPLRIWGITDGQLKIVQVLLVVGFFLALTLTWYHGERGEQRVSGVELLILAGIMGLGGIGIRIIDPGEDGASIRVSGAMRLEMESFAPNHNAVDFELGPAGSGVAYDRMGSGPGFEAWFRAWDEAEGAPIPGTVGGIAGTDLSPDGLKLAYNRASESMLWVQPVRGGAPLTLSDSIRGWPRWRTDGYIYFAATDSTVHRVPEDGGTEEHLIDHEPGEESWNVLVEVDPGRRAVAYRADETLWGIDLREGTRVLLAEGDGPELVGRNVLLFQTPDDRLVAGRLDTDTWTFRSDLVEIADDLRPGGMVYDLSSDGTLAYWQGGNRPEFVWVDRAGNAVPVRESLRLGAVDGANGGYDLSPDETRIAFRQTTEYGNDIWVLDLNDAAPPRRLTTYEGEDRRPAWSEDGQRISFLSNRATGARRDWDLWEVAADGSSEPRLIYDHPVGLAEGFIATTGHAFVRTAAIGSGAQEGRHIFLYDPASDVARPVAVSASADDQLALSPDGRWLAHVTQVDGDSEPRVVVREVLGGATGDARPMSGDSGSFPFWSHDGQRLYYENGDGGLVELTLELAPTLRVLHQEVLFDVTPYASSSYDRTALSDGRFLMLRRTDSRLIVIVNWLDNFLRTMR